MWVLCVTKKKKLTLICMCSHKFICFWFSKTSLSVETYQLSLMCFFDLFVPFVWRLLNFFSKSFPFFIPIFLILIYYRYIYMHLHYYLYHWWKPLPWLETLVFQVLIFLLNLMKHLIQYIFLLCFHGNIKVFLSRWPYYPISHNLINFQSAVTIILIGKGLWDSQNLIHILTAISMFYCFGALCHNFFVDVKVFGSLIFPLLESVLIAVGTLERHKCRKWGAVYD